MRDTTLLVGTDATTETQHRSDRRMPPSTAFLAARWSMAVAVLAMTAYSLAADRGLGAERASEADTAASKAAIRGAEEAAPEQVIGSPLKVGGNTIRRWQIG